MNNFSNKSMNLRRERNADLLRRMSAGESVSNFNSFSSWYPPRPIIEKDSDAIAKLYGDGTMRHSLADIHDERAFLGPDQHPLRLA